MISIIIPAYNEERVIAATLKELVPGAIAGELEVIVVCNGCTDNAAANDNDVGFQNGLHRFAFTSFFLFPVKKNRTKKRE